MRVFVRLRHILIHFMLASSLFWSCGIDDQPESTTPKPPPDITGVWRGKFVNAKTSAITQITRLSFVKSAEDTYAVNFDIQLTLEGWFLRKCLSQQSWQGTIESDGSMFLQSQSDSCTLTMSSQIKSPTFIKGNYMMSNPFHDDGTWEVNKFQELDP